MLPITAIIDNTEVEFFHYSAPCTDNRQFCKGLLSNELDMKQDICLLVCHITVTNGLVSSMCANKDPFWKKLDGRSHISLWPVLILQTRVEKAGNLCHNNNIGKFQNRGLISKVIVFHDEVTQRFPCMGQVQKNEADG